MPRHRKKRAKTLSAEQLRFALERAQETLHPERDRVIVMLSFYMGLRACEIAALKWRDHLMDAQGHFTGKVWVAGDISKMGREREILISVPELMEALTELWAKTRGRQEYVIYSPRENIRTGLSANSVAQWFKRFYAELDFDGCSSHSGRRTFGTGLSRRLHISGSSLRDVQRLLGHENITTTEDYLDVQPSDAALLATAGLGA